MNDVMAVPYEGAIQQQSKGEIAALIEIAHRYPRNEERAINKAAAMACESEEVAQGCFYSVPRAGKRVNGPSVRLAEILASQWGNLHVGVRVLDEGEREVMVEGVCIDLESNVRVVIPKRRRIVNKEGERYSEDMIQNTINAASSIAFRDAVFRVIPRMYVNKINEMARTVALGGAKSMKERRHNAVKYWENLGVDKKKLLTHLGYKDVDSITVDDLDYLLGLAAGIKNRDYDVDEAFRMPRENGVVDIEAPPVIEAVKPEEAAVEVPSAQPQREDMENLDAFRERIRALVEERGLHARTAKSIMARAIGTVIPLEECDAMQLAQIEAAIASYTVEAGSKDS